MREYRNVTQGIRQDVPDDMIGQCKGSDEMQVNMNNVENNKFNLNFRSYLFWKQAAELSRKSLGNFFNMWEINYNETTFLKGKSYKGYMSLRRTFIPCMKGFPKKSLQRNL